MSQMEYDRWKEKREERKHEALFSEPSELEVTCHNTAFYIFSAVLVFLYLYLITLMCGGFSHG